MSLSNVLKGPIQQWANVYFNNVYCKKINGEPVPAGFDSNPSNIIYRPGSVPPVGSNIVSSWADVVTKANKVNVNQCLNVYFDDSIITPCVVDSSLDCQGRVTLQPYKASAASNVQVLVNDGTLISNPKGFIGSMTVKLDSRTGPCLLLNNGSIEIQFAGSQIGLASTATVPGILIQGAAVLGAGLGSQLSNDDTGNAVSLISVDANSSLILSNVINSSGSQFRPNLISSVDNTAFMFVVYDCSVDISTLTAATTAFTGTKDSSNIDKAQYLSYNDTAQAPISGSSNVQGVIDWLKTQIGGGGGSPNSSLIYRPGSVPAGNVYNSWAQICAVSASLNNMVDIFFDNSLIGFVDIQIDQSYDFKGQANFYSYQNNPTVNVGVVINNGVLIRNVKSLNGLLQVNCDNIDGNPSLEFDPEYSYLNINRAVLTNSTTSTGPYLRVPDNGRMRIELNFVAQLLAPNGPGISINVGDNATLFIGTTVGCDIGTDTITGSTASSTMYIAFDSSVGSYNQDTSFIGSSVTYQPIDYSNKVFYDDAVISPPLSADNVQGAIDQIKTQLNSINSSQVNLVFKQGAGNIGNVYGTWGDIVTQSFANDNFVNIYFDDTNAPCQIDQFHDFQNKANFYSISSNGAYADITNGVTISNIKSINDSLYLRCYNNPAANVSLNWTTNSTFTMTNGSTIEATDCVDTPILIPNGENLDIIMYDSNFSYGNYQLIGVGQSAVLDVYAYDTSSIEPDTLKAYHPTAMASLNVESNVTDDILNQPAFAGANLVLNRLDDAKYVDYDDNLVAPLLGPDVNNVQDAIDIIKSTSPLATMAKMRVIVSPNITNVTGNGTQYIVKYQSVVYDNNTTYNTGSGYYTIPTNGYYLIQSNLLLTNVSTATTVQYGIITNASSTTLYDYDRFNPNIVVAGSSVSTRLSTMLYLTAGSSIACSLLVGGQGADTVGISGGGLLPYSFFAVSQIA